MNRMSRIPRPVYQRCGLPVRAWSRRPSRRLLKSEHLQLAASPGRSRPRAARHMVLLLEPPGLPPVLGDLAAPGEGVVPDVAERPAQRCPVAVLTPEDDPVPFGPALQCGDDAVRGRHDDHPPD